MSYHIISYHIIFFVQDKPGIGSEGLYENSSNKTYFVFYSFA